MLPIHAELTGDPAVVRWVVPSEVIPGRGTARRLPEPLARLAREAVVTCVESAEGGILVRLADGESWRTWSEPVRRALVAALEERENWETEGAADLATILAEVLAGPVGAYIRSHGGEVRVLAVDGDDATLELSGRCADCPLQGFTMQRRIGEAVRDRYPGLGELALSTRRAWPLRRPSTLV